MKKMLLVLACLTAHSAFAASETMEFDTKDLTSISVDNTAGLVTVTASTGPKAVVTTTKNKFSEKCKMTLAKTGSVLSLKVERSDPNLSTETCNVTFDIKAPKILDLDLALGSGDLSVTGIEGALSYKIGSGNIFADGSFKKIDGKSGGGKVDVKGLTGGGEIKTGSGIINLTFASAPLTGELDIKTGSGNATVSFPKGSKVKTNFRAGSGKASSELGDSHDAPFTVSMKAGSADLKIKSY